MEHISLSNVLELVFAFLGLALVLFTVWFFSGVAAIVGRNQKHHPWLVCLEAVATSLFLAWLSAPSIVEEYVDEVDRGSVIELDQHGLTYEERTEKRRTEASLALAVVYGLVGLAASQSRMVRDASQDTSPRSPRADA